MGPEKKSGQSRNPDNRGPDNRDSTVVAVQNNFNTVIYWTDARQNGIYLLNEKDAKVSLKHSLARIYFPEIASI